MSRARSSLLLAGSLVITLSGCARRQYYYAPPPPPPAYVEVPPLIRQANAFGASAGAQDGARDAFRGAYHPRAGRAFRDTPGYDPNLGPFPPYRDAFRNAYLRAYDQSSRRR